MNEEYIRKIYDNLGGESKFGSYDSYYKLITTDDAYIQKIHSAFGDDVLGSFDGFSTLVKKNGEPTDSVLEDGSSALRDTRRRDYQKVEEPSVVGEAFKTLGATVLGGPIGAAMVGSEAISSYGKEQEAYERQQKDEEYTQELIQKEAVEGDVAKNMRRQAQSEQARRKYYEDNYESLKGQEREDAAQFLYGESAEMHDRKIADREEAKAFSSGTNPLYNKLYQGDSRDYWGQEDTYTPRDTRAAGYEPSDDDTDHSYWRRNEFRNEKDKLYTEHLIQKESKEGDLSKRMIREFQEEEAKKKGEEKKDAQRKKVVESEAFNAVTDAITPSFIDQSEEEQAKIDLNKLLSPYGFSVKETGVGDALTISAYNQTEHTVDLQPFFESSNKTEAKALQDFVSANADIPFEGIFESEKAEDEFEQARRLQKSRNIGRDNGDGSFSSVLMASAEIDGKYVAVPTLFPKSEKYGSHPSYWEEYKDIGEAYDEAVRRGEVYVFDTEEEAQAFAEGGWKGVSNADYERKLFMDELGLSGEQYGRSLIISRDAYDEKDFAESAPLNRDELSISERLKYGDKYYHPNGKRRDDYLSFIPALEETIDSVEDILADNEYMVAAQKWDQKAEVLRKEASAEAVAVSNEYKGYIDEINNLSVEAFGVPYNELTEENFKNATQEQVNAANDINIAIKDANNAIEMAANVYEQSETFLNSKYDKALSAEIVENWAGVTNAWKTGYSRGKAGEEILKGALGLVDLDDDASAEEVAAAVVKYLDEADTGKTSGVLARFHSSRGFREGWNNYKNDPYELMVSLAAESLSQMLPYGWKIVGSTVSTGAATGAAIGASGLNPITVGAGALTGASWGLRTGMAATSFSMEYTNAVIDAISNQGYDITDPLQVKEALQKQEVWDEGLRIGGTRGAVIGAMDIIAGGVAGRLFKTGTVASKFAKVGAFVGERMVFDTAAEGAGELLAQIAAGQEIELKEITAEMLGAGGNQTSTGLVNMARDLKGQTNITIAEKLMTIEGIANERSSNERVSNWANRMEKLGQISADQNQRIQENVGLKRDAKEVLVPWMKDGKKRSKAAVYSDWLGTNKIVNERVMTLLAAEKELSSTPQRKAIFSEEIRKINEEVKQIALSKELPPVEQQVVIAGMGLEAVQDQSSPTDIREGVSKYELKGKSVTREKFLEAVNKLSNEGLQKLKPRVENDDDAMTSMNEKLGVTDEVVVDVTEEEVMSRMIEKNQEIRDSNVDVLDDQGNVIESKELKQAERKLDDEAFFNETKEELLKQKRDAIQEQSAEGVDVQEQTVVSEEVGEGDTQVTEVTEEVEAEEVQPVLDVVDKVTPSDREAYNGGTIEDARKESLLAGVAKRLNDKRKLTKFQQTLLDENNEAVKQLQDRLIDEEAVRDEATDLESLLDKTQDEAPQLMVGEEQNEGSQEYRGYEYDTENKGELKDLKWKRDGENMVAELPNGEKAIIAPTGEKGYNVYVGKKGVVEYWENDLYTTQNNLRDAKFWVTYNNQPESKTKKKSDPQLMVSEQQQNLAPNGKPSNLSPEQYKLVRTPAFKKWFGDWETDPENASKVLDENGEPLVVYHGGPIIKGDSFRKGYADGNLRGDKGIYFTENKEFAKYFAHQNELVERDKRNFEYDDIPESELETGEPFNEKHFKYSEIYPVFLNLKKPTISETGNANLIPRLYEEGADGFITKSTSDFGYDAGQYIAFEPNQIKLADGRNKTFDPNEPSIQLMVSEEQKKVRKLAQAMGMQFDGYFNPQTQESQIKKAFGRFGFGVRRARQGESGYGGRGVHLTRNGKMYNPFKTSNLMVGESQATQESTENYQAFVENISKAFPNVEVIATQEEFDSMVEGLEAQQLLTKDQVVYGAVVDGKLYLNPSLENYNTPVHEFGHVWLNVAKNLSPEAYEKGLELVENSEYIAEVENNPTYKAIIEKKRADGATDAEIRAYILEEALATAIGDKGESFVNEAKKKNFKSWLKDLFEYVKKLTGISGLSSEQIQNMTLDEFTEAVVVDLMSENEAFVNAESNALAEDLQLMTTPQDASISEVVKVGRESNFSDAAIRLVLKGRGFKTSEINEALKVNVIDLFTEMPPEFNSVTAEGNTNGVTRAIKMFESVKKKLETFNKKKDKTKGELRAKAIELLEADPIFKQQSSDVKEQLIVGLSKTFDTRADVTVQQKINNIKNNIKQRKSGAKTLLDAQKKISKIIKDALPKSKYTTRELTQINNLIRKATAENLEAQIEKVQKIIEKKEGKIRKDEIKEAMNIAKNNLRQKKEGARNLRKMQVEMKNFIRRNLPKSSTYTQAQINKQLAIITKTTEENFDSQVLKVMEQVEKQRQKMKTAEIKTIKGIIAKASKKKSVGDSYGKAFFTQAKAVLKLVMDNDVDGMVALAQELSDDEAINKALLKDEANLTTSEREMLDKLAAFDTFSMLDDMSLEEVISLKEGLKDVKRESSARLKEKRKERAERMEAIKQEGREQIEEGFPDLYTVDGKVKNENDIAKGRKTFSENMEKDGFWKATKEFLKDLGDFKNNPIRFVKNLFKHSILHLGTITNILDKAGDFFKKNIYESLNGMIERFNMGVRNQNERLDSIANSIEGITQGYSEIKKLLKGDGIKITGFTSRGVATDIVTIAETLEESLSNIRRKKAAGEIDATAAANAIAIKENAAREQVIKRMRAKMKKKGVKKSEIKAHIEKMKGAETVQELVEDQIEYSIEMFGEETTGPVNISREGALRVYSLSKNPEQRQRLYDMGLTDEGLQKIEEELGSELTQFADKVVDYLSNDYYESVNNVYKEINDVDLKKIDNYFPTKTLNDKSAPLSTEGQNFGDRFSVEYASALKNRVSKDASIDITVNFTQQLDSHFESMERYKAFAEGVKTISEIMKMDDVQVLLKETGYKSLMQQLMENVVNPEFAPEDSNWIRGLLNKFYGIALGFKIIQFPKQATSFINAYSQYSLQPDSKIGFLGPDLLGFAYDTAKMFVMFRTNLRKARSMSATFDKRVEAAMRGDVEGLEGGIKDNKIRTGLGKWWRTAAASPTTMGDIMGVMGYMTVYNRNIKNGMSEAEAVKVFNDYNRTQQTRRGTELSGLQVSAKKTPLLRLVTMFSSTLFLQMNEAIQAAQNIARDPKAIKKKDVRSLYLNVAVANMLFIAMSNVMKLTRGDKEDKEEVLKELRYALIGLNQIKKIPEIGSAITKMQNTAEGTWWRDPNAGLLDKVAVDVFKSLSDEDYAKALIAATEIAVGFNSEIFIGGDPTEEIGGLAGIATGNWDEEAMDEALGISKSYRPSK